MLFLSNSFSPLTENASRKENLMSSRQIIKVFLIILIISIAES